MSAKPFSRGFTGSKTLHSEFSHKHNGPKKRPDSRKKINFLARSKADPFQKKLNYTEDEYERKEDMKRFDWIKQR